MGFAGKIGVVCAAAIALLSCELAEVSAPDSDDLLVVEAVLRVGAPRQFVLLHRSLVGPRVPGEPAASVAVVTQRGDTIPFLETQVDFCFSSWPEDWGFGQLQVEATCYVSPATAGYFVHPGATYELRIETAAGEVARGRTTVPGGFAYTSPAVALDAVSFSATCVLPDGPFTLAWSRSDGAWAYVVSMQIAGWAEELRGRGIDVEEPIELTSVSVSAADTTLLFPENVGLFQRGEIDQRVFAELRTRLPDTGSLTLAVVATDRNYTNAIRGGQFNPSGNVRISSVVGDAVGVFGSIVPIVIRSYPDGVPACPTPLPPGLPR